MTLLLPGRRRAERFSALVDDVQAGVDVVPDDPRDAVLLELVSSLGEVAQTAPVPRPAYAADLRARLMAEADEVLVATDRRLVLLQRPTPRRQSRLTAGIAAVVLAGTGAGVAVAADHSLPGETLYPVKRGMEQVGKALSFGDAGRGRDELGQASTRLQEVSALLRDDAPDERVATTLRSFTRSAGDGGDLLFTTYQRDGDSRDVTAVREFAGTQMGVLRDLSARAPTTLQPDFAAAARVLTDLDQQARVLCSSCGARAPLQPPEDLSLASADVPLDRLLSVSSVTRTADAKSSKASGSSGSSGALPDVTIPPLSALLGTGGADGSSSAAGGTGGTLGRLLPLPQTGVGVVDGTTGTVTDTTGKVTKGVGKTTGKVTGKVKGTVKDTVKGTVKGTKKGVGGTTDDLGLGGLTDPLLGD